MGKITIAIINHSFQVKYFSRRWELFAEQHPDFEVYLLAPTKYAWYKNKSYTFGNGSVLEGRIVDNRNFHIRLFNMINHKFIGWTSHEFEPIFKEIQPDVIYSVGTHNMLSLKQILKIREKSFPRTKVIAFSMRGPALNLKIKRNKCNPIKWVLRRVFYQYQKNQLNYINNNVDAFFCHYPDAVDCFRKEGYQGPIYMQTQVGVNEEWFYKNDESRKEIRKKLNIGDSTYVFGSATRFTKDKGIDIILNALPIEGDWKYLMMGSGSEDDKSRLRAIIQRRGLKNKVIETGFVDWYEISKYWNAIDCAIHVPITTESWEETFSLSVIQPQITQKPVIGSSSGSVPYQIGFEEMIVTEGSIEELAYKINWVLEHKEESEEIGKKMYIRTKNSFEIRHLNELFYRTLIEDIIQGKYDLKKVDMANCNIQ